MTELERKVIEDYLSVSQLSVHNGKCPSCHADTGNGYTHFHDCRAVEAYRRIESLVVKRKDRDTRY